MTGFFDLSAELRIRIYQYVLVHDHRIELSGWPLKWLSQHPCVCDHHLSPDPRACQGRLAIDAMRPFDIALTQVSRQLRAETLCVFYGQNDYIIDLNPRNWPRIALGLDDLALRFLRRLTFVMTGSLEHEYIAWETPFAKAEYRIDLDSSRALERIDEYQDRPVCAACENVLQTWIDTLPTVGGKPAFTRARMSDLLGAIENPHFTSGGHRYPSNVVQAARRAGRRRRVEGTVSIAEAGR